jgi:hypothetical protein
MLHSIDWDAVHYAFAATVFFGLLISSFLHKPRSYTRRK